MISPVSRPHRHHLEASPLAQPATAALKGLSIIQSTNWPGLTTLDAHDQSGALLQWILLIHICRTCVDPIQDGWELLSAASAHSSTQLQFQSVYGCRAISDVAADTTVLVLAEQLVQRLLNHADQ